MKKLLMMVLVQLMVLSAAAQMADYQKAVAKYKAQQSIEARYDDLRYADDEEAQSGEHRVRGG